MAAGAVKCAIGVFGLWAVTKVCFALRDYLQKLFRVSFAFGKLRRNVCPFFFVCISVLADLLFPWFASFLDVFFCPLVVRVRASQGAGALFVFFPDLDQRYIWCTYFAMYNQYSVYQNLYQPRFFFL